jgi:methylated-DNA-[protein]-cysteine S-methyltransferase
MKAFRSIRILPPDAVYDKMVSPVGKLIIITSSQGLHAILWETDLQDLNCKKILDGLAQSKHEKTMVETKQQLTEYFQAKRKKFDLPLVIKGTDFQRQCWQQLLKIPYGKTISYGEQAVKLGDKNKCRAVGMAHGSNPISIIIPCHRVIGSNGELVGFGGGLSYKQWLIEHEKEYP